MDAGQEGQLTDLVEVVRRTNLPCVDPQAVGEALFAAGVRAPVQDADDELLHGIFTTAMEGGVNYWAVVTRYHWAKDQIGTDDLQGFHATLRDVEDELPTDKEFEVTRETIRLGMTRLRDGQVTAPEVVDGKVVWKPWRKARQVWADEMSENGDASSADVVVQAGLFGQVRYG